MLVDPESLTPILWTGVLGVHPFLRLTCSQVMGGGSSPEEFDFTKPTVVLIIARIQRVNLSNIGSGCQAAFVRIPFYKDSLKNFLKNTFERIMFPS